MGPWGVGGIGKEKKNPYATREMNLMLSRGRGEDHHSLLLTIKIRLASTVSTLASVKAWQEREGGHPPVGVWEFAMWTMETPRCLSLTAQVPQRTAQVLYLLASTVTDGISSLVTRLLIIGFFYDLNINQNIFSFLGILHLQHFSSTFSHFYWTSEFSLFFVTHSGPFHLPCQDWWTYCSSQTKSLCLLSLLGTESTKSSSKGAAMLYF